MQGVNSANNDGRRNREVEVQDGENEENTGYLDSENNVEEHEDTTASDSETETEEIDSESGGGTELEEDRDTTTVAQGNTNTYHTQRESTERENEDIREQTEGGTGNSQMGNGGAGGDSNGG